MNRTAMILIAAGMILVSAGIVISKGLRNRRQASGGMLELTERELRLPPVIGDSTALLLDLQWRVDRPCPESRRVPAWLDASKLRDLGLNCSLPATDPHAKSHYAAMRPVLVYGALRLDPDSDRKNEPRDDESDNDSRLVLVDVAANARRLREKYPAAAACVISRVVVRVDLLEHDRHGQLLSKPRVVGRILQVVPDQLFVPKAGGVLLQGLRPHLDEREEHGREPRFAATVKWGDHFEPWVDSVRLLRPPTLESKNAR